MPAVGGRPLTVWPLCPAGAVRGQARWATGWGCPDARDGRRRAGTREGPVLLQRLERPDPHTIGDPTPRDGRGFDGLE